MRYLSTRRSSTSTASLALSRPPAKDSPPPISPQLSQLRSPPPPPFETVEVSDTLLERLRSEYRPELCAGELSAQITRIACTSAEDEEALWAHPHNTLCQVCGNGGRVVACAYCNLVWHAQCLAEAAAAGEKWRCPECVADQTAPVIGAASAFVRRQNDGM